MEKKKKMWFTSHAKSSAAMVSIGIHALLIVVAISFVAVTVITKEDKKFEAKQVTRPKMPIKKLQVPVSVKKKKPKPKLRKRIVVKPNINKSMPDIKMPEISGLKSGMSATAGLGSGAGLGFSMPEISVFGIRSKGEKVFLALDADSLIMRNEVGGLASYTIIKDELRKIISGLRPTTLFNLAVFEHGKTVMLFPKMVPANSANITRIDRWLEPLNTVQKDAAADAMGANVYGVTTLGKGGTEIVNDYPIGDIRQGEWGPNVGRHWYTALGAAMEQQADTVFILTGWYGVMRYPTGKAPVWKESNRQRWDKCVREGEALLKKENEELAAKGELPRVIRDHNQLIMEYFSPELWEEIRKPEPEYHDYTAREFAKATYLLHAKYASKASGKTRLKKQRKDDISLNVIFFAAKGSEPDEWEGRLSKLTSLCNGKYRRLDGLEAVKSSVSGNE